MLLRQKNVKGKPNKSSLSQQSACQNYGPTQGQVGSTSATSDRLL